jgi:hypothetical protein
MVFTSRGWTTRVCIGSKGDLEATSDFGAGATTGVMPVVDD